MIFFVNVARIMNAPLGQAQIHVPELFAKRDHVFAIVPLDGC